MSTVVAEAVQELVAALKLVPGVGESQVFTDMAAPNLRGPAMVIGPPELDFVIAVSRDPTEARFPVWAVVDPGPRDAEELWELVPLTVAAIEEHTRGVVRLPAVPAAFSHGTGDLPSYQIVVEVPLT